MVDDQTGRREKDDHQDRRDDGDGPGPALLGRDAAAHEGIAAGDGAARGDLTGRRDGAAGRNLTALRGLGPGGGELLGLRRLLGLTGPLGLAVRLVEGVLAGEGLTLRPGGRVGSGRGLRGPGVLGGTGSVRARVLRITHSA